MTDTSWIKPGAAAVWKIGLDERIARVVGREGEYVRVRFDSWGRIVSSKAHPSNIRRPTPAEAAEIDRLIPQEKG